MNYELLDHTTDLRIRVYGKSFEDLMSNAGHAIADLILPDVKRSDRIHSFKVSGSSKEQILVRFLNELIYLIQTEYVVYREFDISEKDCEYSVNCTGSTIGTSDFPEYDLKGATYHDLSVEFVNGRFMAEIIIDI